MSALSLICLIVVFFFTAVISVVTGGTSLITVPVMMQFGINPLVSVATNMLALVFLSFGGSLPFLKSRVLPRERLPALISLTMLASALGAFLLQFVPSRAMPLVIATAMICIAVFALLKPRAGLSAAGGAPSARLQAAARPARIDRRLGGAGAFAREMVHLGDKRCSQDFATEGCAARPPGPGKDVPYGNQMCDRGVDWVVFRIAFRSATHTQS